MILAALLLSLQAKPVVTALDAEKAFAEDARTMGQWTAFAKWADDKGVLVGRDRFIPARNWAAAAAQEGEPAIPVHWWSAASFVSCDEGSAVNTGPFFEPGSGTSGRFTTVWRKGDEGDWRYLLDMGVENDVLGADDAPETRTASCDNVPGPAKLPPETSARRVYASDDQTLLVTLDSGEDHTRLLTLNLWNGQGYDEALVVERPAP